MASPIPGATSVVLGGSYPNYSITWPSSLPVGALLVIGAISNENPALNPISGYTALTLGPIGDAYGTVLYKTATASDAGSTVGIGYDAGYLIAACYIEPWGGFLDGALFVFEYTPTGTSATTYDNDTLVLLTESSAFGWTSLGNYTYEQQGVASGTALNFDSVTDSAEYALILAIPPVQPPSPPSLSEPSNGSAEEDPPTFGWTYNPTFGDGAENAIAFRYKVSGASSYSYYNASTGTGQSTIYWNTWSSDTFTPPTSLLSGGTVYNWSVATQEATYGLQSNFAPDYTVTIGVPGSASITAPSGIIGFSAPVVTLAFSGASGTTLSAYRYVVYTAAQTQATGFAPGGTPNVYDTGMVSVTGNPPSVSFQIPGNALPENVELVGYGMGQFGSLAGAWSNPVSFTINPGSPAIPVVSVTPSESPTTGLPYLELTVSTFDNLLTWADSSFEDSTGATTAVTNCSISSSLLGALDGSYSLQMLSTNAGPMSAASGQVNVAAYQNVTWMAYYEAPAQSNRYDQEVAFYSPLGWWKLADPAGSTTAADSSGNGHSGTVSGGVTFGETGPLAYSSETAALFNGSNGEVTTSYNPSLTEFSVVAWVNVPAVQSSANPRLVANSHTEADYKGFELFLNGSSGSIPGVPLFAVGNGTTATVVNGSSSYPTGEWLMFVGTYNGSEVVLYQNGAQIASGSLTGTVPPGTGSGISMGYDDAYNGDFLDGDLAQCALIPSALTAQQVQNLWLIGSQKYVFDSLIAGTEPAAWWKLADAAGSTTAADSSGNGYNGTVSGGVTFGETGPVTYSSETAALFNGSTGEVTTSYNPSLPELTLLALVNMPSGGSDNNRIIANSHNDVHATNNGLELFVNNNLTPVFSLGNETGTSGGNAVPITGPNPIPTNEWVMIAGTYDGTTMRLYVNAEEVASAPFTGTVAPGPVGVGVGYNPAYDGDYFNGTIAHATIVPNALSEAQLQVLWGAVTSSAVTAPEAVRTDIQFLDGSGVVSVVEGNVVQEYGADTTPTSGWIASGGAAEVPAGAVFAQLVYNVLGTASPNEIHLVDCAGIFPARASLSDLNLCPNSDFRGALNNGPTLATGRGWNASSSGWAVSNSTLVYTASTTGTQYTYALPSTANQIPVVPGTTYTFSAYIDATQVQGVPGGNEGVALQISQVLPTGLPISTLVQMPGGQKGVASGTWTCPSDVTQVTMVVSVWEVSMDAGAAVVISQPSFTVTPDAPYSEGPTWTRGGLVGGTRVVITRSDGALVRNASTLNPLPVPSTQVVTIPDAEVVSTVPYTYTATVQLPVPGSVLASPSSWPSDSATLVLTKWWEFNPLDLSTAVAAQVTSWSAQVTEQSTAHLVMGQPTPNVVANAMGKTDGVATFETFSNETFNGLEALLLSQATICVSSSFGELHYVRFGPQTGGMSSGVGNKTKDAKLHPSTAAGPYRATNVSFIAQPRPLV